jgi:hypothetical protein
LAAVNEGSVSELALGCFDGNLELPALTDAYDGVLSVDPNLVQRI